MSHCRAGLVTHFSSSLHEAVTDQVANLWCYGAVYSRNICLLHCEHSLQVGTAAAAAAAAVAAVVCAYLPVPHTPVVLPPCCRCVCPTRTPPCPSHQTAGANHQGPGTAQAQHSCDPVQVTCRQKRGGGGDLAGTRGNYRLYCGHRTCTTCSMEPACKAHAICLLPVIAL
jgi:hypothetical protein